MLSKNGTDGHKKSINPTDNFKKFMDGLAKNKYNKDYSELSDKQQRAIIERAVKYQRAASPYITEKTAEEEWGIDGVTYKKLPPPCVRDARGDVYFDEKDNKPKFDDEWFDRMNEGIPKPDPFNDIAQEGYTPAQLAQMRAMQQSRAGGSGGGAGAGKAPAVEQA